MIHISGKCAASTANKIIGVRMQIQHVNRDQLMYALAATNQQYDGNIHFKRWDRVSRTGTYKVTLTVSSSFKPGAKINPHNGRHIHACCWHVFRTFLQYLPENAVVTSAFGRWRPDDMFLDPMVGSQAYPYYASECCEC